MRIVLIFMTITYTLTCFSQESRMYVSLSQNANYRLKLPDKGFTDTESNLNFGFNFDMINASISLFGTYAYGGVVNYTNFKFTNQPKNHQLQIPINYQLSIIN